MTSRVPPTLQEGYLFFTLTGESRLSGEAELEILRKSGTEES